MKSVVSVYFLIFSFFASANAKDDRTHRLEKILLQASNVLEDAVSVSTGKNNIRDTFLKMQLFEVEHGLKAVVTYNKSYCQKLDFWTFTYGSKRYDKIIYVCKRVIDQRSDEYIVQKIIHEWAHLGLKKPKSKNINQRVKKECEAYSIEINAMKLAGLKIYTSEYSACKPNLYSN